MTRIVMTVCQHRQDAGWSFGQGVNVHGFHIIGDVKCAFFHAEEDEEVYVGPPMARSPVGVKVCAPAAWQVTSTSVTKSTV